MSMLSFVLIGLMAAAAPAAAQNVDISGRWEVNISTSQGAIPPATMVLKKDGDRILGTLSSMQGDAPVEAEVKDKDVAIYLTFQGSNGTMNITFSGVADGHTMTGTVDFGGMGQGEWSAKRDPASAPAAPAASSAATVNGTWQLEVTSDMGTGTPTVVLKQDGETLSGRYTGQFGEAPVTGTLKGSDVSFSLEMSAQGQAVHISYKGTVDKDSMKGTVSFGDMGQGTFTGKRTQ